MATVTVYEFELFNPLLHKWIKDPRLATLEAIHGLGGVALHRTAMVIDESRMEPGGFISSHEKASGEAV